MRIVIYLSKLGRMVNELSVNSDDVEEVCVGVGTVLLSGDMCFKLDMSFFVVVCTEAKFSS